MNSPSVYEVISLYCFCFIICLIHIWLRQCVLYVDRIQKSISGIERKHTKTPYSDAKTKSSTRSFDFYSCNGRQEGRGTFSITNNC